MGWIQALCQTYDNYFDGEPPQDPSPLVPVGFIEKDLNLRINLLTDGSFHSAAVLEEKERRPVPSSPMAEGRTGSTPAPFPLCDELRYAAGDLSDYTSADYRGYCDAYLSQLDTWCDRPDAPPALHILRDYLKTDRLVGDLIKYGVLYQDSGGKLLNKWAGKTNKPTFFNLGKPAEKCVVDFAVQEGDRFVPLREMVSVQESWQHLLLSLLPEQQLCYASGELTPVIYNHAKLEGNAKLISAKDNFRDFQYKGRFEEAEQAYSVGYTASAKAHNTLRWLRNRQGFTRYGATFIAWSTACRRIVAPQDDAEEGWGIPDTDEAVPAADAETAYGIRVRRAMEGWRKEPAYQKGASIVMLGMEAATPGRMSINYYQELDGSEYLERLGKWYTGCCWVLPRQRNGKWVSCVATPNLHEIGEAVFGPDNMRAADQDKKAEKSVTRQIKSFHAQLLSCIANGRPVPEAAARSAFERVCRPAAFTDKNGKWQRGSWLKCLAVTCAMEKSSHIKEEYQVALDRNETDTSYLFGRLMAVADCAEMEAMAGSDSSHRQTNAIRYFSAVQQRSSVTWQVVEARLQPYLKKLGNREGVYRKLLDEIGSLFEGQALLKSGALTPHFLQGYHCQREAILRQPHAKTT